MQVFADADHAGQALPAPFVTVGNFDGLHRGHLEVVRRLLATARSADAPTLAVTFRPHPAAVLSDGGEPPRLSSDAQRRELWQAAGVSGLLVQPFDADFARCTAEEFYRGFLHARLGARGIVVGAGFRFGAHRQGDVRLLASLAAADRQGGPLVAGVEPLSLDGGEVSSSRIRELLAVGDVAGAARLLGRPFTVDGSVVRGEGRGRKLGFPTANVEPHGVMTPGTGVHACLARCGGRLHGAVTNVGRRPTFGGGGIVIETHVLDFAGDLQGSPIRVAFLERLRDERRFAGIEELVAQVGRDVARAREIFRASPPALWDGVAGT